MTNEQPIETVDYRIDHYYSIHFGGFEEGHIFCTLAEGKEIEATLQLALPDADVTIEPGGEYDYTTESSTAAVIAADIIASQT